LDGPQAIAVSGSDLFIADDSGNRLGEYTTSGTTVNASLIVGSGLNGASRIAISGSDIFVANYAGGKAGSGTISEYTTSGATVNPALVTGLDAPAGLVVAVPEPSTWMLLLGGLAACQTYKTRKRAIRDRYN
jgi:hypothetical protein